MEMDPVAELRCLLRPAAGGIHTVSTGTKEQRRVQEQIYGASTADEIDAAWQAALQRIPQAEVVILAVPSDVGAGFMRGTSFGPQSIRRELLRQASWLYRDARVVDAGDVRVVPQLLHDEMLSAEQLALTREAMYGDLTSTLQVSPLSIAERALDLVRALNPKASPLLLGGDHSVGWPGLASVATGREHQTGILHVDAHTDMLQHRLGVRYCFATWAFHANELVGRQKRLAQVGLRISGETRAHWEESFDVRQYWMEEMNARPWTEVADEIIANFTAAGVQGVYVSNDIDGTDPFYAMATGTPEPGGLLPQTVERLIRRIGEAFPVWGSDLVEVAPGIAGHSPREPRATLKTAARYVEVQARTAMQPGD